METEQEVEPSSDSGSELSQDQGDVDEMPSVTESEFDPTEHIASWLDSRNNSLSSSYRKRVYTF